MVQIKTGQMNFAKRWKRLASFTTCVNLGIAATFACVIAVSAAPNSSAPPSPVAPAVRIVSFAPSNTELLFSVGGGDRLIGVCTYCDYPAQVKNRERVGTFVSANLERLARLKPDTIILVSGQEALASLLKHNGLKVQVLANNHLSDISANLRTLGQMSGREKQANATAEAFDNSLRRLQALLSAAHTQPKVFYCVWPQPLLTVGNSSFLNDVITTCGGINISANLNAAYPHFSTEKLVISNPAIIILPYESEKQKILSRPPWSSLSAVKTHQVYYLPAAVKDELERPTLRILDGIAWLCARLHPELKDQLQQWHADVTTAVTVSGAPPIAHPQ